MWEYFLSWYFFSLFSLVYLVYLIDKKKLRVLVKCSKLTNKQTIQGANELPLEVHGGIMRGAVVSWLFTSLLIMIIFECFQQKTILLYSTKQSYNMYSVLISVVDITRNPICSWKHQRGQKVTTMTNVGHLIQYETWGNHMGKEHWRQHSYRAEHPL